MGMPFIHADAGCDDPHSLLLDKGAFDSFEHEHLPRTKYDQIIDEKSNKPGEQAFEVRPRHVPSPRVPLLTVCVACLRACHETKQ